MVSAARLPHQPSRRGACRGLDPGLGLANVGSLRGDMHLGC